MPILRGHCGSGKPLTAIGLAPVLPRPLGVTPVTQQFAFPVTRLVALLDTGADGTCITTRVAQSHNLRNYGMEWVVGIGGGGSCNTWGSHLGFYYSEDADFEGDGNTGNGLFVLDEPLLAVEIPDKGDFDVIIGRDVLTQFGFHLKRGGEWEMDLSY